MSFNCSLWSIKHALYDVCYLLHAKNDGIYFSKAHTCSVRYSTVQYGLVRFLCRFRTTFCASFRWCWPLDSRDVTPRDVVDIFCLLGRVLVVVFARVFLFHQITISIVNVGKVSEYQFHICNTASFFTSQKSKRVNLPISAVLGGFCMAGSRDVLNYFLFHQMTGITNVGKVSEYQFHICNTANFFTSQISKRVNLPLSAALVLNMFYLIT